MKESLAKKLLGDPLQENSNSYLPRKLGFQADWSFGNSLKRLYWKAF
jgi:hypothetical protein